MKLPNGIAFHIRLFHMPLTTRADDLRSLDPGFQEIRWGVMSDGYPLNRDLEFQLAHALVALDRGQCIEALIRLDEIDEASLGEVERSSLQLSRAEALMGSGDYAGAIDLLRPYFEGSVKDPRAVLASCWLYAALVEAGLVEEASSVLAAVERDAVYENAALFPMFALQVADFMAYYGEFDVSERALRHWCALSEASEVQSTLNGCVQTAIRIAKIGLRAEFADEWARSLAALEAP